MDYITQEPGVHGMDRGQVQSLYEILRQVPDYRHKRGRRYEAATVLVLVLLAKMAGERTMSGVAEWVRLRQAWLMEVLGLKRVPCTNTYHYICAHVEASELTATVRPWFAQMRPEPDLEHLRHWAFDGKVLRGSHRDVPTPEGGVEVLNVYAVEEGVVHHCERIESKGFEAATAQAYVEQTDCTGIVITADALHTRPRFVRCIRASHGHYVFIVKRNRPELEAEIRQLFALPHDPLYPVATAKTVESDHGRMTMRRIVTSTELTLALRDEWCDVAQVFVLDRWGIRMGRPFHESICGLTSLPPHQASPPQLLGWLRAHWQIENRCHWRRDATLGEDACTVRHPQVATVLAALNSLLLAIFDHQGLSNVRSAIRTFAAFPQQALDLLTQQPA